MLVLAVSVIAPAKAATDAVLVLGAIAPDASVQARHLQPLVRYVRAHMGPAGVADVELVLVDDRRRMATLLRSGRIDWVSETPFNAVYFEKQANAVRLARRWKGGVPEYRSVFFTRADSDLEGLSGLTDRVIAFEHANSTSGFLLPFAEVLNQDLAVSTLTEPSERPAPGTVGYVFSRNEFNTAIWVHKKIVDAGVLSTSDWEDPERLPPQLKDDFRIIHQTGAIPRAVEVVRRDLSAPIRDRLREVLFQMHTDPNAEKVLRDYGGTVKFDALTAGDNAALARIDGLLEKYDDMVN